MDFILQKYTTFIYHWKLQKLCCGFSLNTAGAKHINRKGSEVCYFSRRKALIKGICWIMILSHFPKHYIYIHSNIKQIMFLDYFFFSWLHSEFCIFLFPAINSILLPLIPNRKPDCVMVVNPTFAFQGLDLN